MSDLNFIPNTSGGSTFRAVDGAASGIIQEVLRLSWGANTVENLVDDATGKRLPVKIGEALPTGGNAIGSVNVTGSVDTELPPAETPADNLTNATAAPRVNGFAYVFDGTAWDRLPGTTVDGALVNLGANNDVVIQTNAAVNVAQINGVTPLMGTGVTGTGSHRVTLATDGQGQVVDNAAFTDGTTRVDMTGYIFDDVAGTALTENDAAAARIDSKRASVVRLEGATRAGYVDADAANGLDVDVTRLPKSSTSSAPAQTAQGTTSGQILASNTARKRAMIQNTGTTTIKLNLGATTVTQTAYHVALAAGATADDGKGGTYIDEMWTGAIQAISSAAGGTLVVTELT